jgi:hypothetical protein
MQVSSNVVIGDVWIDILVPFIAVVSLGFAVYFLFPRVMVSRFVALSPMVMLTRRGRCDMRVCGFSV